MAVSAHTAAEKAAVALALAPYHQGNEEALALK